jgi:hypothetical protein
MTLLTSISRNRVGVHAQNKETDFTCRTCGEISCISILEPKTSTENVAFFFLRLCVGGRTVKWILLKFAGIDFEALHSFALARDYNIPD